MTDKEIIKALECLTGESIPCRDCSYSANYTHFDCQRQVAKDALDLINCQKAEIERLKAHINEVADKVEDKMTYMSGCQNLIQTVKKIILGDKIPTESLCDNCGLCKEREEEAVKEFAERLKSLGRFTSRDRYYIDKIKKEMAGDTE